MEITHTPPLALSTRDTAGGSPDAWSIGLFSSILISKSWSGLKPCRVSLNERREELGEVTRCKNAVAVAVAVLLLQLQLQSQKSGRMLDSVHSTGSRGWRRGLLARVMLRTPYSITDTRTALNATAWRKFTWK